MYFVYIISSLKITKYYTGYTKDLTARLTQHNNGLNRSTRAYGPWEVVYSEKYNTKAQAWKRERQIKSYKGGRAFKALLKSDSRGEVA